MKPARVLLVLIALAAAMAPLGAPAAAAPLKAIAPSAESRSAAEARPAAPGAVASDSLTFLCAPETQLRHDRLCPAQGPSARRAELASQGVNPQRPMPITSIDPQLAYLPYTYRQLSRDGTRTYATPEDAAADTGGSGGIEGGFVYVSWTDCQVIDNVAVYRIGGGAYIRGGSECKQIEQPTFHGLAFSRTPVRPFGWILGTIDVRSAPGLSQPVVDKRHRFQIVQVYDQSEVDGVSWVKVGPDAWVAGKDVAVVTPDPTTPPGVESDRWVSINLFEQTVAIYQQGRLVYATMASTGLRGYWTQPGTFQVYAKLELDDMSGSFEADRSDYYLLQDVPWVLYYDKARALHGAYWHSGYGYPRSHGCVNLSPTDAHWIFNWAEVGTYVYVFDPSGATPTDPKDYQQGGA